MPNMAPVPFGEWRPDVANLDSQFATEAENVFPGANSYKPMPSLLAFATQSLAATAGGNDTYTKVLLHFNGADASTTITDSNSGGSAHVWTAFANAQIDTAQSKFGGASGLFDGTGDWVNTSDHADYTIGSGDFTVDLWFRCNGASGGNLSLAGQGNSTITAATTPWLVLRTTANVIEGRISNGSAFTVVTGTTQFTNAVNTGWHHVAFVRTGNTLKLFVDGVQEGGDVSFSGTAPDSINNFAVGAAGELATESWNGWIDEFRFSVGIARWTAAFTPPTVAYFVGGRCVGLFTARKADGTWRIYGGTTARLFEYDPSSNGWVDITRTSGPYNVSTAGDLWSFDQFGTVLYAVNINDVMQSVSVEAAVGTNFAATAGSPPQARTVKAIGDFLFLAGLSTNSRKIRWSAVNDPTGWTVGTNLCDEQEFPDGGPVMGVAGSEIGYVIQDRSIRTLQFLPGDTNFIFTFSRVLKERGCISPYGFTTVGNTLYFAAEDGFYALLGQQVFTIGQDKVNEWFVANSDPGGRAVMQCVSAFRPYVFWAYYSTSSMAAYDKIILFDWSQQKWARGSIAAEVWGVLATTGLDLDTTGSEPGDSLADSTAQSLDSAAYIGGRPIVGAVSLGGYLSALNGPNLQATLETAEVHPVPGYRAFVSSAYPRGDVADGTITVSTRERLQDMAVWGSAIPLEITGSAAVFSSGRLHRFRYICPAGGVWTHAQGVDVEAQPDGSVA